VFHNLGGGTDIAVGVASFAWKSIPAANFAVTTPNPVEFRLYGWNGTASENNGTVNWRVDDVSLVFEYEGTATPTFEPPALKILDEAKDSITVGWNTVGLAEGGYYFDASESPDFCRPVDVLHDAVARAANTMNGWTQLWQSITYTSGTILTNGNMVFSPMINLAEVDGARFVFNARSYNGGGGRTIVVSVSEDGGDWLELGTYHPANNDFDSNLVKMDLSDWRGGEVCLRISVPSSGDTIGAGVCNLRVESVEPWFLTGYENLHVKTTSVAVTNLTPSTTYHFRARANDCETTTANSAVVSGTTLSVAIGSVEPLDIPPKKTTFESAVVTWTAAANAAGYEIEVYPTDDISPRVIMTKIIYGGNSHKAVELANVGIMPADLNRFSLQRRASSGNWQTMVDLSGMNAENGASKTLVGGRTVLVVYGSAPAGSDLLEGPHLDGGTGPTMNIGADSEFRLYHDNNAVDYAYGPSTSGRIIARNHNVREGAPDLDKTQWYEVTGYTGANLATLNITPNSFTAPVIMAHATTGANTTEFKIPGLKHETEYYIRIRGVNGGDTGPWSEFEWLLTKPHPKTTIIVVR